LDLLKNQLPHAVGPLSPDNLAAKVSSLGVIKPSEAGPSGPVEAPDNIAIKNRNQDPYFYTASPKQEAAKSVEIEESDDALTKILNDRKRLELAQRQIKKTSWR